MDDSATPAPTFDELIAQGIKERDLRNFPAAVECFAAACKLRPQSTGAHGQLAFTYLQAGALDQAQAEYEAALQTNPASADALAGLGQIRRRRGDLAKAIELLTKAITADPARIPVRLALAEMLREVSRFDAAQEQYEAILARDRSNAGARIGLGLLMRRKGDNLAALEHLQAAAAGNPNHIGLLGELAFTMRQLERLDESEAMYERAAALDPKSPVPWRGRAHVAMARGEIGKALDLVRTATTLDPGGLDSRLLLAALLRESGRFDEAHECIGKCLVDFPDDAGVWLEQGRILRAQGKRREALLAFEEGARLDPVRGDPEAAIELVALGQPAQARARYEAVLARAPDDFSTLWGLVTLEQMAGDFGAVVRSCEDLIAKYPKRVEPWRARCRALIQLDRADEALAIAESLPADVASAPGAGGLRLEVYRAMGRREEALALIDSPEIADTRAFGLWMEATVARLAFFDYAGAEKMLPRAPAARAFEHSRVLVVRGLLADARWQVPQAIDFFEQALAGHPDDPGAHTHLAQLRFFQANAQAADRHLRSAIELSRSSRSLRGESLNASQSVFGQLLNELQLDPDLMAELAAVNEQLDPAQRVEPLLQIAAKHPGLTPPAIYLLLALRQAGALEPTASRKQDTPSVGVFSGARPAAIPKRIVQFWDATQAPPAIQALMRTWVEMHPGWAYTRFDENSAREYLAAFFPGDVLDAFERARHPAQASDIFRLAYLAREGGVYVDADDRCTGSLAGVIPEGASFLAYQEPYATLGNNLLACVPGEAVVVRALEHAVEAMARGDSDAIWLATGPGLITRTFVQLMAEQGSGWRRWLDARRVFDLKDLATLWWPHMALAYKNTPQSWLRKSFGKARRS